MNLQKSNNIFSHKIKSFLYCSLLFTFLLFSCKKKEGLTINRSDSDELRLLKPTSIVLMGKPIVHEVDWDSVAEVKFSIKQDKPKLSKKFREPHVAIQPPTITSIPIDSSSVKKKHTRRNFSFT